MATVRMTDRWVKNLTVVDGRQEYSDALVRGLRLRASTQSKSWSVLTRRNGKQLRIPLGQYPDIGLLDARNKANDILTSGSVPNFEDAILRIRADRTSSLEQLCRDYVSQMIAKGQKSYREYERALVDGRNSFVRFMEEKLGRPALVGEVRSEDIADWLRQIFERAPSHARHCRAYLHAVFEWAIKAQFDYTSNSTTTDYGVSVNPVASTPGGAKAKPRSRVLSHEELKILWNELPNVADLGMVSAIRLIISMGGLRISEILHSKIDWYSDSWLTLPETKNGREHALPLTDHAKLQIDIISANSSCDSEYLFPHAHDPEKPMLLSSPGKIPGRLVKQADMNPFQLRDIRRTMKTLLLDGEYVEEREIDIWHNHGQKTDVARKHYSWAEFKSLKLRTAQRIDEFLRNTF